MADQTQTTGGRRRKAWRVHVKGYDETSLYFAPTAGKARTAAWHSIDSDIRIVDIAARRARESDVILPARDLIADQLSDNERHCLLHAFGGNDSDPTKAGHRDYFYTTRDDPPLVNLTNHGLMKPMDGDKFGENMTYFLLTDAGKRVALSLVPEYAR